MPKFTIEVLFEVEATDQLAAWKRLQANLNLVPHTVLNIEEPMEVNDD